MAPVVTGFFVALYPGLGVAMHFLLKAAARRPMNKDRGHKRTLENSVHTAPQAAVDKQQAARRLGGIAMAPFADWSPNVTPRKEPETDRGGVIAPFAR